MKKIKRLIVLICAITITPTIFAQNTYEIMNKVIENIEKNYSFYDKYQKQNVIIAYSSKDNGVERLIDNNVVWKYPSNVSKKIKCYSYSGNNYKTKSRVKYPVGFDIVWNIYSFYKTKCKGNYDSFYKQLPYKLVSQDNNQYIIEDTSNAEIEKITLYINKKDYAIERYLDVRLKPQEVPNTKNKIIPKYRVLDYYSDTRYVKENDTYHLLTVNSNMIYEKYSNNFLRKTETVRISRTCEGVSTNKPEKLSNKVTRNLTRQDAEEKLNKINTYKY